MRTTIFILSLLFSMLQATAQGDTIYTVNNFATPGIRQMTGVDPSTGTSATVGALYGTSPVSSGLALANDGYLYYLIEANNNSGLFSVSAIQAFETPTSGSTAPTASTAIISNVDVNGSSTEDVTFRRLAAAPNGYIYLAATEVTTGVVYFGRFLPTAGTGMSTYEPLGTITLNGVPPAGNFKNGDIAFDGQGNLYALVNQDQVGGQAVLCYAAAGTLSTTAGGTTEMDEVLNVVGPGGTPFTGLVVGLAMASNGNFYTAVQNSGGSTDGGVYRIVKDGSGAFTASFINAVDPDNIGDLATSYFPSQTVLPIEFGPIDAKIQGQALIVNWSTLSEQNNSRFDIEASKDGKEFVKIGSVATKAEGGNSDNTIYYSFSKSIEGNLGLMAISLFSLAFVLLFSRKNKILFSLLIIASSGAMISSCAKDNAQVDIDKDSKLYVRIVQVDKDGTQSTSKVITAYRAD
ncbi:hypothetical protein ABDK00_016775 [Niabella insulamsoli]|uniref:hypothetical protein n=1 Tax=Niabella insulamsoli TaxID=3144874 RepID=UPI0031FBA8F6